MSPTYEDVAELRSWIPREFLEEERLLPLAIDEGVVRLGHAGRPDPQAVGELGVLLGMPLRLVEMPEDELLAALGERWHASPESAAELIADLDTSGSTEADEGMAIHDLEELANQAPVIRLVNLLLTEAVEADASDVHLESRGRGLKVRYRIDGVLREAHSPPAHLRAAVMSRVKIMAELDIAERRKPQDGRVRLRLDGKEFDVRVSTIPSLHGESIVMRLLEAGAGGLGLGSLGMADADRGVLERYLERPQGMLLATGPTGSGKTTTLHALVRRLRTGREKVVAVEDPVEYELADVVQIPVNPKGGVSFARALRSILRQDPDVLLVGEMRDAETAEICVQSALTGHLVMSTLHTNDAPSALARLLDLGVPDYLAASTMEVVLAQRLVRTTCGSCAETAAAPAAATAEAGEAGITLDEITVGRGCEDCHGSGFRGRTGIYELLSVDDEIRDAMLDRLDGSRLRRLALRKGMRPLRRDGWRHVAAGRTTPEEVMRVTSEDGG